MTYFQVTLLKPHSIDLDQLEISCKVFKLSSDDKKDNSSFNITLFMYFEFLPSLPYIFCSNPTF